MFKPLSLFVTLCSALLLVGCQGDKEEPNNAEQPQVEKVVMQEITGVALYRERIALPENAVLNISLQDISLADAKAIRLSEISEVTQGKQAPFEFTLPYNPQNIKKGHRYSVSANIKVDDKLLFITDTAHLVITDPEQTHQLELKMIKVM